MNRAAHRLIGSPRAVTVYFNRSLDSIALEPAEAENEQSFPVSRKQNGWVIHAASFCRHYNIRVPNTEKFVFPKRDEAGRLILNLRETVIVGGIQRKRNRSKF